MCKGSEMLLDSIYDTSRMGYPVYYHHHHHHRQMMAGGNHCNSSVFVTTPPYTQSSYSDFVYGDKDTPSGSPPFTDHKFVYPQFPSPPQSVSPPPHNHHHRNGESFQIKNLLNLGEKPEETDQDRKMRTESVIMKVADQKVFQVGLMEGAIEATTALLPVASSAATTTPLLVCKWEKCYKVFCTLTSLANHVAQVHGTASVGTSHYFCKWEGCTRSDRGFNARYKMLVHVRTHTKEKPHICPECEKSFSRAENLKIHTRSHSGEKPYICPVPGCNKAYSNSSDRFKHTRTHSNEKPYICKLPGCNKRYTDPSSLRKHVKTFKHKPVDEQQQQQQHDDGDEEELSQRFSSGDENDRVSVSACFSEPSSIHKYLAEMEIVDNGSYDCDGLHHHQCTSTESPPPPPLPHQNHLSLQTTPPPPPPTLEMYRLGAIFTMNASSTVHETPDSTTPSPWPETVDTKPFNQFVRTELDSVTPLDLRIRRDHY